MSNTLTPLQKYLPEIKISEKNQNFSKRLELSYEHDLLPRRNKSKHELLLNLPLNQVESRKFTASLLHSIGRIDQTSNTFDIGNSNGPSIGNASVAFNFIGHQLQTNLNRVAHHKKEILNSQRQVKSLQVEKIEGFPQWNEHVKANTVSAGTYSIEKLIEETGRALIKASQDLLGATCAAGVAYSIIPMLMKRLNIQNTKENHQLLVFAVGPLLAGAASNLAKSLTDAVINARLSVPRAQIKTFEKVKELSKNHLENLTPDVLMAVDRIDRVLEQMAKPVIHGKEDSFDIARFARLLRWRTYLLALHAPRQIVKEWESPESRKSLLDKMDESLKGYPPHVANQLKCAMIAIAARSISPIGNVGDPQPKRLQYRFRGPGGTGKNHAVHIFEKILGLPVVELTIPPARDGALNSLLGKTPNAIDYADWIPSNEDVLGKMGLALIEAGKSNAILFIDEVNFQDQLTVDGIKRVFDPENRQIPCKTLDVKIPLHDQTVIFASNFDPSIENSGPINSRAETVTMEVTRKMVEDSINNSLEISLRNFEKTLPSHDLNGIRKIVKSIQPSIIDLQIDKFQGARVACIEQIVANVATNMLPGGKRIFAREHALKCVNDYYSQFSSINKQEAVILPEKKLEELP